MFASLIAQHQNLGDVVIRREMVRWMAECGDLHLLAPDCPDGYIAALDLPRSATVYSDHRAWYRAMASHGRSGQAAMVYSPGPQDLSVSLANAKVELSRTALTSLLRVRRNPVVKLGRSYEHSTPVGRALATIHASVLSDSLVRDARSAGMTPRTTVMPDLAFGAFDAEAPQARRDGRLLVAFRESPTFNFQRTVDVVLQIAGVHGLQPVVVTQVEFDEPLSDRLAQALGAPHVRLVPVHATTLKDLDQTFRGAVAVLSNRLHPMVFGIAHGAVPLLLSDYASPKAESALAMVNFELSDVEGVLALDIELALSATRENAKAARVASASARARFVEMVRSALV